MQTRTLVLFAVLAAAGPSAADPVAFLRTGETIRIATTPPPQESVAAPGRVKAVTLTVEGERLTYTLQGHRLAGELLTVEPDTLTIRLQDSRQLVRIDRQAVQHVEVRRPGRSRGSTAACGLLIGAAAGALVAVADGDDPPGFVAFTAGEKAAMFGLVGAGAGALLGLFVGGGSDWVAVSPSPNVRLSVGPARGGVAAQVRVGF